jgi:hypothetical protein
MLALYGHLLLYLVVRLQTPLRLSAEALLAGALSLAACGTVRRIRACRRAPARILAWPAQRHDLPRAEGQRNAA